jgi:tRNA(adenine34) deaminase
MKSISSIDEYYITVALKESMKAIVSGDVPIGAVIVKDDTIISKAYNQVEKQGDPMAHAEIIAIQKAISRIKYKHLTGCTMYVTLEPCSMCAGALVLARLDRLVFGASDPKSGACGTLFNIVNDSRLNHRLKVTPNILADECAQVIKQFFVSLRSKAD